MSTNIGAIDRLVRVVVGLALLAFALNVGFPATGWNWVGWIGILPLLTGLLGNCPAYTLLGVSTCPMARQAK